MYSGLGKIDVKTKQNTHIGEKKKAKMIALNSLDVPGEVTATGRVIL